MVNLDYLGIMKGDIGVDLLSVVDYSILDYGKEVVVESYSYTVRSRTVSLDGMYLTVDRLISKDNSGLREYLKLDYPELDLVRVLDHDLADTFLGVNTYTIVRSKYEGGSRSIVDIVDYYGGLLVGVDSTSGEYKSSNIYPGVSQRSKSIYRLHGILEDIYNRGLLLSDDGLITLCENLDSFVSRKLDR